VTASARALDGVRIRIDDAWPILACAAALGAFAAIAAIYGHAPWSSEAWAHWDSAHYLSIADRGYEVHRCVPGDTDNAARWCGNAPWLPGYPLLVGALHLLGLPLAGTAVAVSWLFAAAALVLLWRTFLRDAPAVAAAGGLIYAAVAPGSVYDYAVFPISMLFFLTVAWLRFLDRERWRAAGLVAAAAVLTYPSGVVLAVAAAAWIALTIRRGTLRAIALAAAPTPLALLAVVVVQRAQTGRWTAFFDVQAQFDPGFHNPAGILWNATLVLLRARDPFSRYQATGWQLLVVTAILAVVVATVVARRRQATRLDLLLVIWAAGTWAFPLTQAHVSVWRSHAALAPLAVLVSRLPRPLLAVSIAAAIAVGWPIARVFFEGRLI
jgi:hypothetical protein